MRTPFFAKHVPITYPEDVLFPPNARVLIDESHDRDRHLVALGYKDSSSIHVYEHDYGPATYELTGVPHRSQLVRLESEKMQRFFASSGHAESLSNISLFFKLFRNRLCDFMDFLDENLLAYTYATQTPGLPPCVRLPGP